MINYNLNNKVAVVTGGAQGFGLAITKKFIESGAKVIIWDIDEIETKKTLKKINSENCSSQKVDVTNFDNILENLSKIEENFGKIDIFINNAGMTGMNAKVWEYPIEEWHNVINLDLNATFYCCKAVVPIMIKNNYGRIVNISSIAGKEGNPNASAYSAAKAAVIGLTKSIAIDYITKGIRCNCICPGTVDSPSLHQRLEATGDYETAMQNFTARQPMGRLASTEEIAALVVYLASDESAFTTGQPHIIDGGWSG